jgi:hypothetical protein
MYKTLLRSSAAAVACLASIVVLGFTPARGGAGSDRLVRLTRYGPQRTDTTASPAHPYEETAPLEVAASQDIQESKLAPGDSPVRTRRAPRATAAAWWGTIAELSSPTHAPPGRITDNSQILSAPFTAPTDGRAPPAS